jgi:hypothetical protein
MTAIKYMAATPPPNNPRQANPHAKIHMIEIFIIDCKMNSLRAREGLIQQELASRLQRPDVSLFHCLVQVLADDLLEDDEVYINLDRQQMQLRRGELTDLC